MKRVLLVLLISLVITGCGAGKVNPGQTAKSLDYREVYKESIGFSMSGAGSIRPTPPVEDVYLFEDPQSWEKFKNTYFSNIPIPEVKVPEEKILFAQINWPEPLSGPSFRVTRLEISGDKLTVKVKPNSDGIEISPAYRDLFFKYVIILAVDGKAIPGGLKPQLEVIKKDPVSRKLNPDETPIIEHSIDGFSSAMDGHRLIVSDNKALKVFDLTSGKVSKTISVPPYGVQGFDIYGNMVVWSDLRNEKKELAQLGSIDPANADIFTYNLKPRDWGQ
ncbi:MAG: hypothetical protein M0Z31_06860 [Clostridia bacterium]|nr:hypothetical protein [Clostridia bacterium]